MVEFCEIKHGQTKPHLVELLWTRDRPVTETSTWRHKTLTRDRIHAPGRIRTRNPSKRAAADPHLRTRGHRERHTRVSMLTSKKLPSTRHRLEAKVTIFFNIIPVPLMKTEIYELRDKILECRDPNMTYTSEFLICSNLAATPAKFQLLLSILPCYYFSHLWKPYLHLQKTEY